MQLRCLILLDSAIPVVHAGSSTLVKRSICCGSERTHQDQSAVTRHECFCYRRLMLMVVGRGDACVDTHYCSNDGAQNHQEKLDHFSSTLPTFLRLWVFAKIAARSLRLTSSRRTRNHGAVARCGYRSLACDAFCMSGSLPLGFIQSDFPRILRLNERDIAGCTLTP
jgi:hypothetical protein